MIIVYYHFVIITTVTKTMLFVYACMHSLLTWIQGIRDQLATWVLV